MQFPGRWRKYVSGRAPGNIIASRFNVPSSNVRFTCKFHAHFLLFPFFFSFFSTTKEESGIDVPKRYDSLFEQVYLIERFRTYGTGELMKLGIRFV